MEKQPISLSIVNFCEQLCNALSNDTKNQEIFFFLGNLFELLNV